jgi:hypothetical protein
VRDTDSSPNLRNHHMSELSLAPTRALQLPDAGAYIWGIQEPGIHA